MALNPLIKRPNPNPQGYDSSGITAGVPLGGNTAGGLQGMRPVSPVVAGGWKADTSTYVNQATGQPLPAAGGYDSSGINPNGMYTQPRPLSLDSGGIPAPNGPMPTIPPGGIPASPVANPNQFTLPGVNGQQYVATSNGYSGGVPATTFPAGPGPVVPPTIPGYTPQPVTAAPGGYTPAPAANPGSQYTPQTVAPSPAGYAAQAVPGVAGGWDVPDQYKSIDTVQGFMDQLLNSGNPLMQNAARRGLETANSRGLLNGSMAAGASQRAQIEAAQPLLDQAMNTLNAREGMKFTQGENNSERSLKERLQVMAQNFQGGENASDRTQQERLQTLAQNFQGGENASDRTLQQQMQAAGFDFQGNQNVLDRTQQERILGLNQNFQGTQADLDRMLQSQLQAMGINADLANNNATRQNQLQMLREGNAFSGEQNQLNRTQGVNDQLLQNQLGLNNMAADYDFRSKMASDSTAQQDWLNSQSFSRQFNSALSLVPISNAADLNNYLMQAAIQEPEVYTPEVLSGMSQFFNTNLQQLLAQYFPQGTP